MRTSMPYYLSYAYENIENFFRDGPPCRNCLVNIRCVKEQSPQLHHGIVVDNPCKEFHEYVDLYGLGSFMYIAVDRSKLK